MKVSVAFDPVSSEAVLAYSVAYQAVACLGHQVLVGLPFLGDLPFRVDHLAWEGHQALVASSHPSVGVGSYWVEDLSCLVGLALVVYSHLEDQVDSVVVVHLA